MLAALTALTACAPRARLCTAANDCAAGAACVAGRCQPERPGIKPSIEAARRLVFRPVDIGYVRSHGRGAEDPARAAFPRPTDGEGEGLPAQVALGRDGAVLLLRFEAALPANAKVVEAYLVLRRSSVVDDDPTSINLHALRIVEGWNGRSTTFARQPRLEDLALPEAVVEPGGPALVRLDVRELVRLWARRDPNDHGIAVVGKGESPTGTTFALASERSGERGTGPEPPGPVGTRAVDGRSSHATDAEPYLELYVR